MIYGLNFDARVQKNQDRRFQDSIVDVEIQPNPTRSTPIIFNMLGFRALLEAVSVLSWLTMLLRRPWESVLGYGACRN